MAIGTGVNRKFSPLLRLSSFRTDDETGVNRKFSELLHLSMWNIGVDKGVNRKYSDISILESFTIDFPPVLDNPISDQETLEGTNYNFLIPSNTFSDPEALDLTLTATLADDSPLPIWLSFNTISERFSGIPGEEDIGTIELKIIATDPFNQTVFDTYFLQISEDVFAKTRDFSSVFRTLLPKGLAWFTDLSVNFKAIIEGIVRSAVSLRNKFIEVYQDTFPDSTKCLSLWEEQFQLNKTGLSDAERRGNLSASWAGQGGQSGSYIEGVLANLGLDAKVYENFNRVDPNDFLIGGDSEILTNGDIISEERIFVNTAGDPTVTANDSNTVTAGEYSGFITTTKVYSVSPFSTKYVFYFIIASPANVNTPLDVPAALEKAFKTAVLRIKPAHTRAVLNVNYV